MEEMVDERRGLISTLMLNADYKEDPTSRKQKKAVGRKVTTPISIRPVDKSLNSLSARSDIRAKR